MAEAPKHHANESITVLSSRSHGAGGAAIAMARHLSLASLIGPSGPERDLVVAMVAARAVATAAVAAGPVGPGPALAALPLSVNATLGVLARSTLGLDLCPTTTHSADLAEALDWLLPRRRAIEDQLAATHLHPRGRVVCALSGPTGTKQAGRRQVLSGVCCDELGRPVAIGRCSLDTSDRHSFASLVAGLRGRFGVERVTLHGGPDVVTEACVKTLASIPGASFVTTLPGPKVRALLAEGAIEPARLGRAGAMQLRHRSYPGELLVVTSSLDRGRARTIRRDQQLRSAAAEIEELRARVESGALVGRSTITRRAERVLRRYKVRKLVKLSATRSSLSWATRAKRLAAEEVLDGIVVLRTSLGASELEAFDLEAIGLTMAWAAPGCTGPRSSPATACDRHIGSIGLCGDMDGEKDPERVEGEGLGACRIRADRIIQLLAAYLSWHLREVFSPITSGQEHDRHAAGTDLPVLGFHDLLEHLAQMQRVRFALDGSSAVCDQLTEVTPLQRRAFELLGVPVPLSLSL